MTDKILESVKDALEIAPSVDDFDDELITSINTACLTLAQLGVGPTEPVRVVSGGDVTWDAFNLSSTAGIETYVVLKTKRIFDPTASGTVKSARDEVMRELLFRLQIAYGGELDA